MKYKDMLVQKNCLDLPECIDWVNGLFNTVIDGWRVVAIKQFEFINGRGLHVIVLLRVSWE